MVLIHAGFLLYEMGATRLQNVLSSGVKNLLAFAFTIAAWYLFGWWFYFALPTWPLDLAAGAGYMEISGIEYANSIAWAWGDLLSIWDQIWVTTLQVYSGVLLHYSLQQQRRLPLVL